MDEQRLSTELEERVSAFLQSVKFRRRILGGVDEADVWRRINELNDIYKEVWIAERARYDALLAERGKEDDAK